MERYCDAAMAQAFAFLPDLHLAQDAVQESFVAAYLSLRKLQEPTAFGGWLRSIVRHQCHRVLRQLELVFLTLAIGIPLLFHRLWVVFLFYGIVAAVLGSVLSVVFHLAHAVEAAEFPMPVQETGNIEHAWAIHQVETTADFARRSRVAAWLLGGLNFQIEHHLLPRICHINFPALSSIVEETCREYGVKYDEHPSFLAGLASHFRWLRQMGKRIIRMG